MEYGATIWNPYLKGDIDKLERIQNRGIGMGCLELLEGCDYQESRIYSIFC
jgi:hypothetical protein